MIGDGTSAGRRLSRRALLALPLAAALRGQPPTIRVVCGGDVMLSRFVGKLARQHKDPAFPFRDLAPVLAGADIAFVNLESPFCDRKGVVEKGMVFKAEPEMIEGLLLAGIDVVSTANNHSRDRHDYGLTFTHEWLLKHRILPVGTGTTAGQVHGGSLLARHGVTFGFLAYTFDQRNGNHKTDSERVAGMDEAVMRDDVRHLRAFADVVIVSMHAGWEYKAKPNGQQVSFARAAIDAGAAAVIGHHPHVVQSIEEYKGAPIYYSLGNLVFDQFERKETQVGLLAELVFQGPRLVHHAGLPIAIVRTVPRLAGS